MVDGLSTKSGRTPLFFDYNDAKRCFADSIAGTTTDSMDIDILEFIDVVAMIDMYMEEGNGDIEDFVFVPHKESVDFSKMIEKKGNGKSRLKPMKPKQRLY